ncbi:hypothetical protein [Bradyrhizobium sp. SZCCHNPS2010]|uniref:hypothetical protein n=1 Tax=Bradyrhizobium sp. SZCCHNPS2010 TaxID=3057333 RepID=UPI0029169E5E|nr:hypothetical protein [Bradyrhizobium sp. SZCCHNPS2010]
MNVSKVTDPTQIPEWRAIGRECALVRHLIGSGVTALGVANYADKRGEYYTAFFGLSVGLERLVKLILVADYAISNGGKMPQESVVRSFGHKLVALVDAAEEIAVRRQLKVGYTRPQSPISTKIVEALDSFADARRGRYANFLALDNPNLGTEEPINKWWGEVAELILRERYYGTKGEQRVKKNAEMVDAMLGNSAFVLFTNETGDTMRDVLTSSIRSGQSTYVQKFGRYYTLLVVRWLASIFYALSNDACYGNGVHAFAGAYEYFQTYTVEDHFLKTRKKWPLT